MARILDKPHEWAQQFFAGLARPDELFDLFDPLPGIYLYVKDVESRFVRANQVVCDVVGAVSPSDLVGRTDFDYFPPAIAAQYVAEDRRVIAADRPLTNQVWLVPGNDGIPHLYLCNKIPLHGKKGEVVGIAGVKRPYEHSAGLLEGYSRLLKVVAFVTDHYAESIEVADLAAHAGLSVSQLQREFSKHFGITPTNYIREVRIGMARHLLETSDMLASQIALTCGFYDQSHFNHHFKTLTGLTPREYRQRFRTS
ncbi:MAG: AraC family transcriptional regulator [Planctomycetaceae bacterium]|nr:AraC family transcriptional regulator [Planctomycetaceae bacterium]